MTLILVRYLAISTLKKGFSVGELSRLNEMSIDMEKLEKIKHQYDKVVSLKLELIPKSEIIEIAEKIIENKGFCLVKELDGELQKEYIVNARTKSIYFNFLIDLFQNDFFNDTDIQYIERKRINWKIYKHILMKT
jgi:hypothetical protein